jgi:hypothetical protein
VGYAKGIIDKRLLAPFTTSSAVNNRSPSLGPSAAAGTLISFDDLFGASNQPTITHTSHINDLIDLDFTSTVGESTFYVAETSSNPFRNQQAVVKLASPIDRSMSSQRAPPAPPVHIGRALVLYTFRPTSDSQLAVVKDERVIVLAASDLHGNTEWWLCENTQSQSGYVPANYVQMLTD